METTLQEPIQERRPHPPSDPSMPMVIPVSIVWNIILGLGSVVLSITLFGQTGIAEELGEVVQYFAAVFVLIPAIVAALSSLYLLQKKGLGRYLSMGLYFVGFVLSLVYLFHLWGVYFAFEPIVDGVMRTPWLLASIPIAYALFWVAGRFEEGSTPRTWIEMAAIGLGMLALIVLLISANILEGASNLLSTYADPLTWAVTVVMMIFGVMAYRMLHLGEFFGETPQERTAWQGWLMLSPNIIGFSIFFAGPLLLSFYLSFTNSSVGQVPEIIGFSNYAEIFSLQFETQDLTLVNPDETINAQDALDIGYNVLATINLGDSRLVIGAKDVLFWRSLRVTLLFCLLLIPLAVIPAIGLALILNSKIPGMKFYRAIYFLPSVAAVVGTALIWRWLYDPTIGFINYTISNLIDFLNSFGLSLADPEIEWLTGPGVVLFSIVFLAAWQIVGYNTVLFLAGLQGIPNTLYEAAQIDGANRRQQFWNVTMPMLAPTTFFVMITTIVTGLQSFNESYALFPSRPLPINATTSVYYLYERGFARFEFGYASSLAWVLFAIIFTITLIQFWLQRNGAYEG